MTTTTFETAKIGDRVWSMREGWGSISRIDEGSSYPIVVKYDRSGSDTFTFGGYEFKSEPMRTLFWDEVVFEAPAKPRPDLEVDTKVWVWITPEQKHSRHFSHFSDGKIYTFDRGRTSFTIPHDDYITGWDNWELSE